MTDLYSRILLWHKLLAMQTGGLALCSARHRLNRDEAKGWSTVVRNVADDIDAFLEDGTFILDDRGVRLVDCTVGSTPQGVKTGTRREQHDAQVQPVISRHRLPDHRRDGTIAKEPHHDMAVTEPPNHTRSEQMATGRKAGGRRVATRKQT